jgi:hypothetical protein
VTGGRLSRNRSELTKSNHIKIEPYTATQHEIAFQLRAFLIDFAHVNDQGGPRVDTTLKVNVVLIGAVFLFIGAIVLGVF